MEELYLKMYYLANYKFKSKRYHIINWLKGQNRASEGIRFEEWDGMNSEEKTLMDNFNIHKYDWFYDHQNIIQGKNKIINYEKIHLYYFSSI